MAATSAAEPTAPQAVAPYTRAERLLNLLMALRGTRVGLAREQIRSVVRGYDPAASPETFARMFERDKDELRGMGVPVVTLTDAAGVVTGYRIEGDWSLPALDLDRVELAVLGLAARAWQSAALAPAALTALRKVEARVGMSSAQGGGPQIGLSADSPALPGLLEACSTRVPVTFQYRKPAAAGATRRHVQPWGVVWWRAHWYLVGHDVDRDGVRVFRASRIEGEVRPEGPAGSYAVPAGVDVRSLIGRFADADTVVIEVALAPGVGAGLRRGARVLGVDEHGWDRLEFRCDSVAAGVGSVLAVGRSRVVGPGGAVAEAIEQLRAIEAAQAASPAVGRQEPVVAPRPAGGQFARLLALVPWLAANSGVTVAAASAHFGISEEQLLADLGSVITSGADDWTLFDIQYWDSGGVIEVIDALELAEPLQLTPDEGFALLVALQALAATPGASEQAVLDSVLGKLTSALGRRAPAPGAVSVRVDLPDEVVGRIEAARERGRALELTYLGAVRDAITSRTVDPVAVVVVDGYGYLRGWCRSAGALRMFRLDRIVDLRVSALPAQPVAEEVPSAAAPMAVVLAATGRWVRLDVRADSPLLDSLPVTRRWAASQGWVRVEVPVGEYQWARRLVLGSAGAVALREPAWLADQVGTAVRAALAHHGHGVGLS